MKSFEDLDSLIGSVPFDVVADLRVVDTVRGSAGLLPDVLPGLLSSLRDRARPVSIESSAALDGIVVPRRRAAAVIAGDVERLQGREEQELAGCRDAFDHVAREDRGPLDVDLVLDVHRLLLARTPMPGGRLRRVESVVLDRDPRAARVKRFTPVAVADVPQHLDELIARYRGALTTGRHHPVLLTGLFVLDLVAIRPFTTANGRLARALTPGLLHDAGYDVARYVSLDAAIARSAEAHAAALLDSTADWQDARHDPWPWLRSLVRALADCSDELASLVATARSGRSKQERVRTYVLHHAGRSFRMSDARTALPGVSDQTIRLVLGELRNDGLVEVDGVGRSATWSTVRTR
ncbi:Fic family protein [Cellulomonas wangsupingiae]|uniref:Fic family protein n=1 Tax=Cellulomonas wangsupingiae TaxID=2968085 RepID=A0ABY5K3I0_9CELL|nr:Fic family protein [Cellulomonas wangsupingiae]MCC2333423.1 Fic family protein [Cellulomonas wangsupingiae]MCM0638277.1 Fic family protein [Cellulomonas wangsupingiae]UUI63610.1 Fic family protein [Cellulomonas wangsupingiae]